MVTNKAIKYFFQREFCIRIPVWKNQEQPFKGVSSMCFLKVGKSLKRASEGVHFLVKLQVESLELCWYLTSTRIFFQGFSSNFELLWSS